jgi:hypothetical protein
MTPTTKLPAHNPQPCFRNLRFLLAFLGLAFLHQPAQAQLTADPYKFASPENGPSWTTVNPDAWASFTSGNFTRMFGSGKQQDFTVSADYTSRVITYGKKSAGKAILPDATWVGPLFGGEGYTGVSGVLPLQSPDAQKLAAKGGWRYHLTDWVNIDIGGNVILYNKSVLSSGAPVPYGAKSSSPIWVGFTGRFISSPALYITYDPIFEQTLETISVEHVFDMGQLACIPNLHLGAKLLVGALQADEYNGGNKVLGHNWRNGYTYGELELNADYELFHNVYLRAGATWALNTDGSGSNGIAGTNLGPDDNLAFHAGVLYAF